MSYQPATCGERSSSCHRSQEQETGVQTPAEVPCQPTTCGKSASSCCRGQEMEIGAQIPTEETVACQDLDGAATCTASSTATGFAQVDTQHKAQLEMEPEGDYNMGAKPTCELEKKKLRDEMLAEVGGACTTGDGEYDDIVDECDMPVAPGNPTDGGPKMSATPGKATDAPKKGCCCDH